MLMLNVAATDGRVLARIEFSIRSFTLQLPFTSYSSLLSYPLLFFISCISVPHPPCSHLSTNNQQIFIRDLQELQQWW